MYDIDELEAQWKIYNNKKRKPYYYFFISIFVLTTIFYIYNKEVSFYYNIDNKVGNVLKVKNKNMNIILISKSISNIQLPKDKIVNTIDHGDVKIDNDIDIKQSEMIPVLPIINDIPVLKGAVKKINKNHMNLQIIDKPKNEKKLHLNISKSTSVSAYKDVENRFFQSYDTDDSIFLAKSYYRKGNYKKAEFWALETNKVNSNIEESWLIYIKSKVKLGHKNEAIKLLTNYAKKSNSSAAWNLLLKLKN